MAFTPWTAGTKITAAKLAAMTPTWTAWTPTWSTSSGLHTPSYGNATLDCAYCQTGDMVAFRISIAFGSTTDFGAGATTTDNWTFSLPVTSATSGNNAGYWDGSIGNSKATTGPIQLYTTSLMELYVGSSNADGTATTNQGIVDALTPNTWVSGNRIIGSGFYQAA